MNKKIKFSNTQNVVFFDLFKRIFNTEKTANYELTPGLNTLTFMAPMWANKSIIKGLFMQTLDTKVLSVRILNTSKKVKHKNTKKGRMICTKPSEKKVMIRLENMNKIKEVLV